MKKKMAAYGTTISGLRSDVVKLGGQHIGLHLHMGMMLLVAVMVHAVIYCCTSTPSSTEL